MQHAAESVVKALAVCAELTGTELSKAALTVMASDLAEYPTAQVLGALTRCRKELRGRLTLADVIIRLEDGRPGPEEAWAMVPQGEGETVVWTAETAAAYAVAAPLLEQGDKVAARMAFLETYRKLLADARASHTPTTWQISLGWDVGKREAPLLGAVAKGRLTMEVVTTFLPLPEERVLAITGPKQVSTVAADAIAGMRTVLGVKTREPGEEG